MVLEFTNMYLLLRKLSKCPYLAFGHQHQKSCEILLSQFCHGTFLGQSGKQQPGKQGNPTNTKENPADSKHVCQIVTAVTYSLSDYLLSMFVGLYSLPDFLAEKSGKLT